MACSPPKGRRIGAGVRLGLGLLLSLGLLVPAQATQPAPGPSEGFGQIPEDILQRATEVRSAPLPQRIDAISEVLLGRPYVVDPLGEGAGHDPDPLARYDVFDCLTYTEEVLALSLSGDPSHAATVRNSLRYGSNTPEYAHRHHFMELQWIPSAVQNGWLVDTTAEYGEVIRLEREVTDATWQAWNRRSWFALTDEQLPTGPMALNVLPLSVAQQAYDKIRPGSVLLTVREDRSWVPIWVTHVGFVVAGEAQPIFRHATRIGEGGSRDHGLQWYLQHIESYGPWKTLGISILEPVEQGPRISRIEADEADPGPSGAAEPLAERPSPDASVESH